MIAYIKGELAEVYEDAVVLENGGTGYLIQVPASLLSQLPQVGSRMKVHTYLYVREDAISLYGFLSRDDLTVFKLLLTVSGIGPKGALGILSTISPDDLRFAILSDDSKTIAKAPGIGAKTAKKLIIELKDKLKLEEVFEQKTDSSAMEEGAVLEDIKGEAVQALTALGYSATDAMRAVRKAEITDGMTVEELLKASLKNISWMG